MPSKYLPWIVGLGFTIVALLAVLIVVVATDNDTPAAAPTTTAASTTAAPATTAPATSAAPTSAAPPTTAPATTVTTAAPSTTATTAAPATTATTAAPATTASTAAPAPRCADAGAIPTGATDISSQQGDYDGDGGLDDFSAYRDGGSWYVYARLSNGDYRLKTELDAAWSAANWDGTLPSPVIVQGPRTLGDSRQVVSVQIYGGLGSLYALFAVESCQIVPFTLPGGGLPDLYQAMGPTHTDFPVCMEPDAIVQQAGLTCGGAVADCPNLDATVTPYTLTRDPARISPDGGGAWTLTVSQAQYQSLVANSCLGP